MTEPETKKRTKKEDKKPEKDVIIKDSEVKVDLNKFNSWLLSIYDVTLISDIELNEYTQLFQYQGFIRDDVLKQLFQRLPDNKLLIQAVIVCALRGPKAASNIKLTHGQTLQEMGIPASGGKGSKRLTCSRITAATADLAAYYLKRMKVPKRLNHELPSWLQFPSAGSIKMNEQMRTLHRTFSEKFSMLIGGAFNDQIYGQMVMNSYLDPKLDLWAE